MAEFIAGAAKDSQIGLEMAQKFIEDDQDSLEEEIELADNNKKKAMVQAKKSIMKDPDLDDDEKIFNIENLSQSSRWGVLQKLVGGLSLGMVFNTIVYLIIILMLTSG